MLFDITSLLSKDKLVAQALRSLIEAQLDGIGAVSGIDFNSSAKSLTVTLDMIVGRGFGLAENNLLCRKA